MEEGYNVKEFDYDVLQTETLAHWGWSEPSIRLPNDGTSQAALNGPCRVYRLGKPMKLQELEAMPQDLQLAYLRRLRRAGATKAAVGRMLGVSPALLDRRWRVRFDMPDSTAWAAFLDKC